MTTDFTFLADREDAIPQIAQWYFDQWGHRNEGETLDTAVAKLKGFLNRDTIPFMLLAIDNTEIMGVAQLKVREMGDAFPDYEHWLGGVFVSPDHRGKSLASKIANEIARRATSHGVDTLYLQTDRLDGGLYSHLGWQPIKTTFSKGRDVLVMKRQLGNEGNSES